MIEPLETSLASRGMLGSMPIIFIDMVSIDGNYVTIRGGSGILCF